MALLWEVEHIWLRTQGSLAGQRGRGVGGGKEREGENEGADVGSLRDQQCQR